MYGCGYYYRTVKDMIKRAEEEHRFQVLGISGRELPLGKSLDGWKLIPREELLEEPFDSILIMSEMYEEEIKDELIARGVSIKAFDYNLYPKYWDDSLNGITVFNNLCWGGIAAHTLGIECCSPTKDLWISDHEFLKFLSDLKYYLSLEPEFMGWADADGRFDAPRFPLMTIGDIILHCNHDTDPNEAAEKWQRRKKKVNFDNMLAVYITDNPELEKSFYRIEAIEKKYCLVPWSDDNNHSVQIERKKGKTWRESAVDTAYPGRNIDLAAMMRGEDCVVIKGENHD